VRRFAMDPSPAASIAQVQHEESLEEKE
jgi:hypothetical protein